LREQSVLGSALDTVGLRRGVVYRFVVEKNGRSYT